MSGLFDFCPVQLLRRYWVLGMLHSLHYSREWALVETELESSGFLLRDRLGDLMGREDWEND